MPNQSALADLLVKLSVDPELRRSFKDDSAGLLAKAGLSEGELDLVAGGNPDQIRDYLGGDAPAGCFILFVDEER